MERIYACIDLKSFYASVECQERGLDPLTTNLVVADVSRTEKTICLAVTPSLKAYGIGGRARLFEVVSKVKEINREREKKTRYHAFFGESYDANELKMNPELKLSYIAAKPRMNLYMNYSSDIFNIYLKYISADDIYSYSIDEVFCDLTEYLNYYHMSAEELVTMMIKDVYETKGITATAGIGTNMYLAKIAMDIVAKHCEPNEFGVRLASLDELSYRELLWGHQPLTDFWRVGSGTAKRLTKNNLYTMGDIARCSLDNEDLLFKLFGINAELLIDHAWGYEPCTFEEVRKYRPNNNSICSGQVLHEPYDYKKTRLIVKEMAELLSLDLVDKRLVTKKIVLTIGYDAINLKIPKIVFKYDGEIVLDHYGREIPKHAHGTINLEHNTSSTKLILEAILKLYDRIVNKDLLVRRINIAVCDVVSEDIKEEVKIEQFDIFTDYEELEKKVKKNKEMELKERKLQHALLDIKKKYGKNSILKGMNLEEGATTIDRNRQVGGHSG